MGKTGFRKNFLFVTWKNDTGQLAWQIQKEGHKVKVYIDYKSCRDCYDGLLEKIRPWQSYVEWADLVIFDEIGFGKQAKIVRSFGKMVIGGTAYTDELEWKRDFGQKEMERAGMTVLPHFEFTDFQSAIKFISSRPGRYVFKPSGVVSSANHNLLFVGQEKNGGDVLEVLKTNYRKWRYKIQRFMLQTHAEGVEMAIGAFFNGKKFLLPICLNQEYKRLYPEDMGPLTNDMGVFMLWVQKSLLYESTLKKMEPLLAETGYVGYMDINCIINKRGVYPLEVTARFGYPTIDAQIAAIKMPIGNFLLRLASGQDFKIPIKQRFQVGVCAVLPPFISDDSRDIATYHNLGIVFEDRKWDLPGIHFKDVKFENSILRVAGESKLVFVATGSGRTVQQARRKAYQLISKVRLQNLFYRPDIGQKWAEDAALLKKWGYLG